ncbi:O(6)-methylguanine-induced apoptosis 2-like [Corticium candelabrum]|uniref:O(6)-methylguanine-induced apoptosis 2-like n=1 Tax=Corticium candelabrum TaxID=121492 RepID=UPI002E25E27C|nr:O(6)-methylguanine-induced apoptosis 2-like [Corticium candelabrum]
MATSDSVRLRSELEALTRSVGGPIKPGKVFKGQRSKPSANNCTIPSRYQTIVYENTEKKGFTTKAPRFDDYLNVNENPGPGSYRVPKEAMKQKDESSLSRRGTGSFASKGRRFPRLKTQHGLAPGTYNVCSLVHPDYNKAGVTRNFHQPVAVAHEKPDFGPAPNTYNVDKPHTMGHTVGACAAFKSRTTRNSVDIPQVAYPSPCHYIINDELMHRSPCNQTTSFKSTTTREVFSPVPEKPGPGAYNPFAVTHHTCRKPLPRKHYLCLSAPAMPLPIPPPAPGPGHYDVVDYEGPPKQFIGGAVFRSTTSRWNAEMKKDVIPGPGKYRPSNLGKQSFIFNTAGRWL